MPWGAAIAAVGAIGSGYMSSSAAKSAANMQAAGSAQSIAAQERQFQQMLALSAPQRNIGNSALNQLATLTGLPQFNRAPPMSYEDWAATQPVPPPPKKKKTGGIFGGGAIGALLAPTPKQSVNAQKPVVGIMENAGLGPKSAPKADPRIQGYNNYLAQYNAGQGGGAAPGGGGGGQTYEVMPDGSVRTIAAAGTDGGDGGGGAPDYSGFYNSPDYQFALDQGLQATSRAGSAMGNFRSGNTLAALTQYGQGLATQNFGNYVSRLQSLAGIGVTASNNAGQNAMVLGGNIGNTLQNGANARASGVVGSANAWGDTANSLAQIGGNAWQRYQQQPYQPPTQYRVGQQMTTQPVVYGGYNSNLRVA
jgi:hypothetical protein